VEGCVFAWSQHGVKLVVAAELAAFGLAAGVRAPLRVAAGTLLAAGSLRTAHCLFLVRGSRGGWVAQGCPVACGHRSPSCFPPAHRLPTPSPLQSFRDGLQPHAIEELSSIWEWEPPAEDAGGSSAWHVLRQLAVTANKCAPGQWADSGGKQR
jgi:hypothetical protein